MRMKSEDSCFAWAGSTCLVFVSLLSAPALAPAQALEWRAGEGVVWHTPWADVHLDRSRDGEGPVLRFLSQAKDTTLPDPKVGQPTPSELVLTYETAAPNQSRIAVSRRLRAQGVGAELELVETFELKFDSAIQEDVEIVRPFSIRAPGGIEAKGGAISCTLPLKNGWAKSGTLGTQPLSGEYRLGHWIRNDETPELALPVIQLDAAGRWQAAVCADPRFSASFTAAKAGGEIVGEVRYRYASSKVPLTGVETRTFGFWLRTASTNRAAFGKSIDSFFRLMLPEVPAGPSWLHQIYMVGYDFLSDDGKGWDRDVALLASWLKPEERSHVALCLHGWYDALGSYCYDATHGRLKDEWIAFARTRKVAFTQDELKRRLRLARAQGFHVLLYFADGLAADSGVPGYHDDWAYRDLNGKKITGWQGPDTFGLTYLMNPAHPEVQRWFTGYLDALLRTYGPEVDGFVWDETFHARAGQVATQPAPAYCDRAMLDLVKELTARVERFDPQKVFLASDCVGIMPGVPGYAMVADGLYQDTHCNPSRWPDALFPNWRNTYWSCNWGPIGHFHWTAYAVEQFGAPVAISNGYEEDRGPSEWTPSERKAFLDLFRQRSARGSSHVRYLSQNPAQLLAEKGPDRPAPSDPIPTPAEGEVNWALAANGGRATASTENTQDGRRYPAAGGIDGSREQKDWGAGHGWASASGAPLPQWLQVEFSEPRTISRFIITTYQAPNDSARRWGVRDYAIEVWDQPGQRWQSVVTEDKGRIMATRVHSLGSPVTTQKFRVVVSRVAPIDGVARLLQVEAWGR